MDKVIRADEFHATCASRGAAKLLCEVIRLEDRGVRWP